jgi:tRNA (cytidine/uridine-2'-O-)-methyltransferase
MRKVHTKRYSRLAWSRRQRQLGWMRIAFYEPEIAGNVGAILRLGARMGAAVDLIEPMGFEWDDRRVRRTAMDYIDHVDIVRHAGFDAFKTTIGSRRLVLFTTKAVNLPMISASWPVMSCYSERKVPVCPLL